MSLPNMQHNSTCKRRTCVRVSPRSDVSRNRTFLTDTCCGKMCCSRIQLRHDRHVNSCTLLQMVPLAWNMAAGCQQLSRMTANNRVCHGLQNCSPVLSPAVTCIEVNDADCGSEACLLILLHRGCCRCSCCCTREAFSTCSILR